jgi:hypothetical protein
MRLKKFKIIIRTIDETILSIGFSFSDLFPIVIQHGATWKSFELWQAIAPIKGATLIVEVGLRLVVLRKLT